jgi:hypothetical protein
MGEVLYPMVKCRPDISVHAIFLSQYINNPGEEHYKALKSLICYLAATSSEGIYYWRKQQHKTLPHKNPPQLHEDNYDIKEMRGTDSPHLIGFVDSDWATHTTKRALLTGMVLMFAGGTIGYKTKYQPFIAHSSTEAEFVAACDMAKMILFFRSLLDEVGVKQQHATILFEDNNGALMMANAQQPTCHMDIKHFALLDWVERDMLMLEAIQTHNNAADTMTKTLPKRLFYRHYNTYMGVRIPDYAQSNICPDNTLHPSKDPNAHPSRIPLGTIRRVGGGTGHKL